MKSVSIPRLATLLCMALTAHATAHGADLKSIVGHEKRPHADTNLITPPLPKAEEQLFLQKIHRIRDLVLATPALTRLRGYDWTSFDSFKRDYRPAFPIIARVSYIAYPYVDHRGKIESSAEGPPFSVHVNDPEIVMGQNGYNVDKDAGFTVAPRIVGDLAGYPVYEGQFVVMTADRRPLFIPVTQQQYLEVLISKEKKDLEQMRKRLAGTPSDDAAVASRQQFLKRFETKLADLQNELATLAEADRLAPARFAEGKPTRPSHLAEASAPSSRHISMLNPKLFDPAKPKTSIQVITLGTTIYLPAVYDEVQKQLDLAALASLLQ